MVTTQKKGSAGRPSKGKIPSNWTVLPLTKKAVARIAQKLGRDANEWAEEQIVKGIAEHQAKTGRAS